MNLLSLTEDAESAVATYRNPNISAWIDVIDPVLHAAGLPCIGRDSVQSIDITEQDLTVTTAYCVRGCSDTSTISLPLFVLRAADPVKAATRHRLETARGEARQRTEAARRALALQEASLEKLNREFADFMANSPEYANVQ